MSIHTILLTVLLICVVWNLMVIPLNALTLKKDPNSFLIPGFPFLISLLSIGLIILTFFSGKINGFKLLLYFCFLSFDLLLYGRIYLRCWEAYKQEKLKESVYSIDISPKEFMKKWGVYRSSAGTMKILEADGRFFFITEYHRNIYYTILGDESKYYDGCRVQILYSLGDQEKYINNDEVTLYVPKEQIHQIYIYRKSESEKN